MTNLVQRTLSGSVYVAVVVGSILCPHPAVFAGLFCLVSMLAVREYSRLRGADSWLTSVGIVGVALLFLSVFSLSVKWSSGEWSGMVALHSFDSAKWLVLAYLIYVLFVLIAELFRKAEDPIKNWGEWLIGQVMIGLPFALMSPIFLHDSKLMLALFITIWVNDTGAYCVGSLTGKLVGNHKMFPRVSPGKSWEGLVGGIVFAQLGGYVFYKVGWFDFATNFFPTLDNGALWAALGCCLLISVFGTLGDLMESLFKRTIGVKDSGKFLPGHGGVLDRFDSILLATPAVFLALLVLLVF